MNEARKEYLVGWIRATNRPDAEGTQLNDQLPPGIRIISLNMNFRSGSAQEFGTALPAYEEKIAELAAKQADLILPGGAPPFMLLGFAGERQLIRGWEQKYGVPIYTSGQNHVRALHTLGVHKFIGASYFQEKMNAIFTQYFTEAGFQVLAMEGMKVPFDEVPQLPPEEIYNHIKAIFEKHRDAEGIYMLGSAWKSLGIIERLEQTLGVPVIHPAATRCWETQLRLGFRSPVPGYGRLLAQMPEPVPLM